MKLSMAGFLLILMLGVATAQQPQSSILDSLEDRAAKGDAKSQCAVAEKYDPGISGSGDISSKDLNKAIEWYLRSAKQGYAEAQCNLGFLYQREPLKNYSEALKWFRMAADQEYANAQNSIGVIYNHGFGVPKDSVEAIKWYRKAAENGDAVAQFNLGVGLL